MNFGDLLQYLDDHSGFQILDGTPAESIAKAKAGTHQNPIAAEIIIAAAENLGLGGEADAIERVAFVNSLGKIRLKYMADDAPVEGFRTVEKVITTADAAFNEEALRERAK